METVIYASCNTVLCFPPNGPTMLYEDNTGAIALAQTGHFKGRSKHFDLRLKWVVDMMDLGLFKLDHETIATVSLDDLFVDDVESPSDAEVKEINLPPCIPVGGGDPNSGQHWFQLQKSFSKDHWDIESTCNVPKMRVRQHNPSMPMVYASQPSMLKPRLTSCDEDCSLSKHMPGELWAMADSSCLHRP